MKCRYSLILFAAAYMCACSKTEHNRIDYPLAVTVSLEPQRQLLSAIGGDRVAVTSLLANGADPETYDPTIASLMHLEKSKAWFQMGNIQFEKELAEKIGGKVIHFDTSAGIDLIEGSHGHHHEDDHDEEIKEEMHNHNHRHHGHSHDGIDPHTWSSVRNMKIIGANMLAGLIEIDPEGTDYYTARFDSIAARLDSLDANYSRRLAGAGGSAFMVWHPSLSYFARDYDLRQISVAADHRETSLLALQSTIDKAIDEGVKVFFEQSSYDPRLSATVREHIGAICTTFDPLAYDWEEGLNNVVDAIASNASSTTEN